MGVYTLCSDSRYNPFPIKSGNLVLIKYFNLKYSSIILCLYEILYKSSYIAVTNVYITL